MLHMVDISEIKRRAEAINLSLKTLARTAGVDPSTVYRSAAGAGGNNGSTLRKLTVALEAEESRVREHLAKLSGDAA